MTPKRLNLLTPIKKKVGTIAKDTSAGPFADEWNKAFGDISKDVEEVDISMALSAAAFSVKDENELVGRPCVRSPLKWLTVVSDRCAMRQEQVPVFSGSFSWKRCHQSSMPRKRLHIKS